MDRISAILRHIVFFIWPIPFLLGFAMERDTGWPEAVAYAAAGLLAVAAAGAAYMAVRRRR